MGPFKAPQRCSAPPALAVALLAACCLLVAALAATSGQAKTVTELPEIFSEHATATKYAEPAADAQELASSPDSEIKSKVFDFKSFKRLFHKSYGSLAEEMRRQTLFLANLFQSITSYFKYKHKRSSSYRAVNQMSDWTADEFRDSLMDADSYLKQSEAAAAADALEAKQERERELERAQSSAGAQHSRLADLFDDEDEQTRLELVRHLQRLEAHREQNYARIESLDGMVEDAVEGREDSSPIDEGDNFACALEDTADDEDSKASAKGFGSRLRKGCLKFGKSIASNVDGFVQDTFRKFAGKKYEHHPELPDEILADHRQGNCLTRPKNQGHCGSCYIFAALALYEWAYCRQEAGRVRVEFSEQYVVDCGKQLGLNGCKGGLETSVAKFVDAHGLELAERYRYRARKQECPYEEAKVAREARGFVRMDSSARFELVGPSELERQLAASPMVVAIFAPPDIHHYGGGVDEGRNCGTDRFKLHAVLLVGHGRQDGHEFWIIRNSWGAWWGESGYYRVRKASRCLADFGYGKTIGSLRVRAKAGSSSSSSSPPGPKELEQTSQGHSSSKRHHDLFKFLENPKYDWKILAHKFQNAESPPSLPKASPMDSDFYD